MSYFTHLHGHSDYSIKDAISTPERMAKRLKDIDQHSVALTDHGQMSGIAIFDKQLKKHGVKLIAGNEMYIASLGHEDRSTRDTAHITLLAMNKQGYHNLCKLHSLSWQQPNFYYDPRVDFGLLEQYNEGIIALSGCMGGVISKPLLKGHPAMAEKRIMDLKQIFDGRFYIEIQDHRIDEDFELIRFNRQMAKRHNLTLVATNDFHYVNKADWAPHDKIIACGTGQLLSNPNRPKAYVPEEFFIKDYDEMSERFEDAVLLASHKIAELCEPLALESKVFHLPMVEKQCYAQDVLAKLTYEGCAKRYHIKLGKFPKHIIDRIEYELDAIEKGGFTQYLLLMADMYRFMDSKGIPYGPGRGSAAASIVCYALGITGVCPIEYGLLFERFINPERVSAPDIDCDISASRRGEVISYLKERWGQEKVVQIATFNTMGARAAIRDMARVMSKPLALADKLAKLVPQNGSLTTDRESRTYLLDALATVPEFKAIYDSNSDAREIIDAAVDVEGLIRQASVHAAGIVISDKPVTDYAPLLSTKPSDSASERPIAVAYDMNQLEYIGLIKFDLLGLIALDTIDTVVRQLKAESLVSNSFKVADIQLDDKKTFSLLSSGLTQGVFQFESTGMSGWLRKLKPDSIKDLIAMVALYRPGPMAFISDYVERKLGKVEINYPSEELIPALQDTYGVAVFQEQLMQIGQIVAGWSLARADQLRKVIGKKIIDKIAGERQQFVEDAQTQGYKREFADDLFANFIEPAARYSFNRGHATVYATLAYQTAYLKANYPCHYFGALLEAVAGDRIKTAAYITDARALGVSILPPCLNSSSYAFQCSSKDVSVRYGLAAIKNVGLKAVKLIIKERERNGPFIDVFDFVSRTRDRLITSRTLESLVMAGACDDFPGTRHEQYASLPNACARHDMQAEDRERVSAGKLAVKRKRPIPEAVLVKPDSDVAAINELAAERELLGSYLSGHPIHKFPDVATFATHTLQDLRTLPFGEPATVVGIVSSFNEIVTKKKSKMATFVIEDDRCSQEVVLFPKEYSEYRELIELDLPIVVTGRLEGGDDDEEIASPKLLVTMAQSVDDAAVKRKSHGTVKTDINRYHLRAATYEETIASAIAPCQFVLPSGTIYHVS